MRRWLITLIIEALDERDTRDLRRRVAYKRREREHYARCEREGLSVEQARIRWRKKVTA